MRNKCDVDICLNTVFCLGYCQTHYRRLKKTGDLRADDPVPTLPECDVDDCVDSVFSKGYCQKHYYRIKRYGNPESMRCRKGAERINEEGHIWCSRCEEFVPPPRRTPEGWCNECKKLSRYKLSKKDYYAILERQGFVCPICILPGPDRIDHDHSCCSGEGNRSCGKCVRGILHHQCNAMLGKVEDNLDRIIKYLGR